MDDTLEFLEIIDQPSDLRTCIRCWMENSITIRCSRKVTHFKIDAPKIQVCLLHRFCDDWDDSFCDKLRPINDFYGCESYKNDHLDICNINSHYMWKTSIGRWHFSCEPHVKIIQGALCNPEVFRFR